MLTITVVAERCGDGFIRTTATVTSTTYGFCMNETDAKPMTIVARDNGTVYHQDEPTSNKAYYPWYGTFIKHLADEVLTCRSPETEVCNTKHIFETEGVQSYAVNIGCGATSTETIFMAPRVGAKQIPVSTGFVLPVNTATTTPGSTSPTATVNSFISTGPPASTSGPSPPSDTKPRTPNRAIIVGAVVGSLIGVVLIAGFAAWLVLHHRKWHAAALQVKQIPSDKPLIYRPFIDLSGEPSDGKDTARRVIHEMESLMESATKSPAETWVSPRHNQPYWVELADPGNSRQSGAEIK